MAKAISYRHIKEKRILKSEEQLTDEEALIRALDLIDFFAALRVQNPESCTLSEKDEVSWIELKHLNE